MSCTDFIRRMSIVIPPSEFEACRKGEVPPARTAKWHWYALETLRIIDTAKASCGSTLHWGTDSAWKLDHRLDLAACPKKTEPGRISERFRHWWVNQSGGFWERITWGLTALSHGSWPLAKVEMIESTTAKATGNIFEKELLGIRRTGVVSDTPQSWWWGTRKYLVKRVAYPQTINPWLRILLYPAWHRIRTSNFRTSPLHCMVTLQSSTIAVTGPSNSQCRKKIRGKWKVTSAYLTSIMWTCTVESKWVNHSCYVNIIWGKESFLNILLISCMDKGVAWGTVLSPDTGVTIIASTFWSLPIMTAREVASDWCPTGPTRLGHHKTYWLHKWDLQ